MAPIDPEPPLPDWGTDTLQRFRYQAEVTFPFCLAAALGRDGISAVIPEHGEDIALDCDVGWRYLQVKTRNLDLGMWTLPQLLKKNGGALRSLYRTHRCVRGKPHTLELILEGAAKSGDAINHLRLGERREKLAAPIASAFGIAEVEASAFLDHVVLNASPAPRDVIAAINRDLIHSHASSLTWTELVEVHQRLLIEIERAMRAERMGALWPRSIAHPERRSNEMEERLALKRLEASRLRELLGGWSVPSRPALRRLIESGSKQMSSLERKLLEGGAPPELINLARNLQANARYARLVRKAQGRSDSAELIDDLQQRIEVHALTKAVLHQGSDRPATHIWSDLLQMLESRAASIDHAGLLERDPMLLLGEACDLSDQCRFGWGVAL